MAQQIWRRWFGLVTGGNTPQKRVVRPRQGWGDHSEPLENRALLSAANCAPMVDAPEVAEVANVSRKAQQAFPTINGTWTVDVTSEYFGSGTVTFVQNGKVVTSTVSVEDVPTFTTTSRFKRNSPNELTSKSPRIEVPGIPIDIRVTIKLKFPSGNLNPTSFTGSVTVPIVGEVGTLVGSKNIPAPASSSAEPRKAAPVPQVAGAWTVTVSNIPVLNSLTGQLNLKQRGRNVTGSADLGSGTTFSVKSKIDRKNPTQISGTATVTNSVLGIQKAPFTLTLSNNNTHFAGTTVTQQLGTLNLAGDLNVNNS